MSTTMGPFVDGKGVEQIWSAVDDNFVAKEDGKGLSTHDLTDELLEKVNKSVDEDTVEVKLTEKADAANVYTKEQVYTQAETDQVVENAVKSAVSNIYKFKGSIAFAELPTQGMVAGDTYNIKEDFTTTEAFVEGAGVSYPTGTNVAYTEEGKWDCLGGTYDFSEFLKKDDIRSLTEEEIAAICVLPTA